MKKLISILAVFTLAMSFCAQTASAAVIDDTVASKVDYVSVMNAPLRECLAQATDDDLIRVTIELKDNIDLSSVELKAVSRAKLSAADKASLNKAQALSLTDAENESVQLAALKVRDKISEQRYALLEDHYNAQNGDFISSTCLKDAKIGSVGIFTPFIRDVSLTKDEIIEIAKNPEVCRIDYYEELHLEECNNNAVSNSASFFQDINDTYKLVGGDAFINAGYTGSGIRVGFIEKNHPNLSKMGSDANNIIRINPGVSTDNVMNREHSTMVCGIIKKFAPSCSIYSYAMGDITTTLLDDCSRLIREYSFHVVNLSIGDCNGTYTTYARELDRIIRNTRVPVVVAAGNAKTHEAGEDDGDVAIRVDNAHINILGTAANAITVGYVITSGTNPDAPGAFELAVDSCFEEMYTINKPDICAPGNIRIYSVSDSGTSFAAPHVTGTIVQMMARNSPGFVGQPQKLKAALLASATRNCGTDMDYIDNTIMSNEEGAGVLDAEFCYRLSKAGRATHFDVTSAFTPHSEPLTHNVYCDYTTKPFRIACTWEVAATDIDDDTDLNVTNYNMTVYKNGTLVAFSRAPASPTAFKGTNCEIVEIPTSDLRQYGGGYYEVRIYRTGDFYGDKTIRIGLAWEQD